MKGGGMQLTVERTEHRFCVSVAGEVDLATAPELDTVLLAAIVNQPQEIVIDLTDVSFLDSTGLGVIVRALKRTRERGTSLNIIASNERVLKVFAITGLDSVLSIYPTLAALDL